MKSELEEVINELAQYIIFGEGYKTKNTYKKEKIEKLDKNTTDINKIYNKFRNIEQSNYFRMEDEEIFYRQAKYLENFEDNYKEKQIQRDSFRAYERNCIYARFSLSEFRSYFTWRTQVRKGKFEKTEYGYEEIYINELLNKIGCKDAKDAIDKLIDFWKECRQYTLKMDSKMPKIIKEFYIINDIKTPYTEIIKAYPIEIESKAKHLKEIKKGIYSGKLKFLNDISTYKIAKSKLLETEYANVLEECTEKVLKRLHEEFEKSEISLPDMLVYKNMKEYWWEPLNDYAVYQKAQKSKEIIIEGTEKYECKNGQWNRTRYTASDSYKNLLGYILKTMECYIREYLGYRNLKFPEKKGILNDGFRQYYYEENEEEIPRNIKLRKIYLMDLQQIIQEETIKYLQSKKIPIKVFQKKKEGTEEFEKEEKIEIKFNQEQFSKIREKSEEIQKALIIEEEITEEPLEEKIKIEEEIKEVAKSSIENNSNDNIFKTFICDLTSTEKEVIQILIQKQDVENKMLEIAQKQNQMLEVMVSNINDKALETIGDTVIESSMSSIYEDYEEDIKQVL